MVTCGHLDNTEQVKHKLSNNQYIFKLHNLLLLLVYFDFSIWDGALHISSLQVGPRKAFLVVDFNNDDMIH